MERENQRIALTKRLLKEGLLNLLREQELDKISVTQLCRESGINRATFYRHYQIPRDVLMEIQMDLYHDLRRSVNIPWNPEDIRGCIEQLCTYLEQNTELLRVIIRSNSDTDFARFIGDIYEELWKEFGGVGIFKDMVSEDMKLLTIYSAGGSYFILRHWLLGNIHKSAKEMAMYVYELLNRPDWEQITAQLGLLPRES